MSTSLGAEPSSLAIMCRYVQTPLPRPTSRNQPPESSANRAASFILIALAAATWSIHRAVARRPVSWLAPRLGPSVAESLSMAPSGVEIAWRLEYNPLTRPHLRHRAVTSRQPEVSHPRCAPIRASQLSRTVDAHPAVTVPPAGRSGGRGSGRAAIPTTARRAGARRTTRGAGSPRM